MEVGCPTIARKLYVHYAYIITPYTMETRSTDRINARVPKEQKQLFERAALVGGFRNLTDFILDAAQKKADEIIREHQSILASERDRQLFFNELTEPTPANDRLKEAAARYKDLL